MAATEATPFIDVSIGGKVDAASGMKEVEASVDWLRTKGLAAAAKKAGRVAAEGLVGIAIDGTKGAVVEINAETDAIRRSDTWLESVFRIRPRRCRGPASWRQRNRAGASVAGPR